MLATGNAHAALAWLGEGRGMADVVLRTGACAITAQSKSGVQIAGNLLTELAAAEENPDVAKGYRKSGESFVDPRIFLQRNYGFHAWSVEPSRADIVCAQRNRPEDEGASRRGAGDREWR